MKGGGEENQHEELKARKARGEGKEHMRRGEKDLARGSDHTCNAASWWEDGGHCEWNIDRIGEEASSIVGHRDQDCVAPCSKVGRKGA